MKLIREVVEQTNVIVEEKVGGKKIILLKVFFFNLN